MTLDAETTKHLSAIWHRVHSQEGLAFPLTVKALSELHVSRYRVDYAVSTITAYTTRTVNADDDFIICDFHTTSIPPHTELKPGSIPFQADKLVEAIRKAQRGEGNYIGFSLACVEAGVTDYTTYIEGEKVVYCGAKGEIHTEWFPGAGPSTAPSKD